MSIKIIDGMGESPHITSNDIVSKQQAWLGSDSCVFHVGNEFAAELADSNTITIQDGVGSIKGCSWQILDGTTETVPIANGTQAMYRKDLIVARYTRDSEGVESVALDVLQGTSVATKSEAAAPAYTESDIRDGVSLCEMPLYEVMVEGLNVPDDGVTSVMEFMPSLQEMYGMNPYNIFVVDELPSTSERVANSLYFVKAKTS